MKGKNVNMKKRILAFVISVALSIGGTVTMVAAYEFPNSFWALNEAYINAVNTGDNYAIIDNGNKIIELMQTQPEAEEVINVLADRMQKVAESYAAVGMYDESASMYERFIPYGQKVDWKDSLIIAGAYIDQYKTVMQMYTDGGSPVTYNAKNEPYNGVLFGVVADSETRSQLAHESAILVYHELGHQIVWDIPSRLQEASDRGLTVEFALNCPNEGADIADFESKKSSITEVSELLKKYPNVPILLRFGGEMNIWTNPVDPQQFISAFRYTADYFRQNNPNVAMVWSPGAVSRWGEDVNVYYPGDEYVDWVGMSFYCSKYFLGNPDSVDYEEAYFKTGINSDPVLLAKEIVTKYGDRKPIMLSESGASHKVSSSYITEDSTDWAVEKIKEIYSYIPMVYPQIKFIAHFDTYVNNEMFDYSLEDCPILQKEYISLTKRPSMIKYSSSNSASTVYRPVYDNMSVDGMLPVSTYMHVYNDSVNQVAYYVDGEYKGISYELPFNVNIDLQGLTPGTHTLKAVATTAGGKTIERQNPINVQPGGAVSVYVNGSQLNFDAAPSIHNGRTTVPLRAIFEALNATVDWNAETRTITSTRGATTVSLTVDENVLYKNGDYTLLDAPAQIVGASTYVPLRAVSESFDCQVDWDGNTRTVTITAQS